ncbi:uncharacterized membrane protein YebE (DUF533 family) [Palleronia aestuarii]|uniref:Uncharacterized membrane protein YebE (DUF533 family) n=1 Tax=Palleronia aestuarii TaxID=568105 RepID=A0A2W7NPK9_9RHOB|nr:DUF533 domain-containing protein [Palleronia aestuarii]PZX18554.1 uncharacterized membrane protein YebE (DUF533 family) [Palleronia aestuarii]
MSLKNMAVKMALAFAAAKGVQAFSQSGGIEGMKRRLNEQQRARGGSGSGLGGLLSGGGSSGGLGGLLGQLGLDTTSSGSSGQGNSLGGLLGGLAGASGGAAAAGRMEGLLDTTRRTPEGTEEEEQVSGLMIRAMVQSARADGEIDAQERATLMEVIGDSDAEETAFIEAQMTAPVDPEALARDTPKGHEVEVYTASVIAIEPDNRAEAEHLDKLARALGLAKSTVNDIHAAQGKAPLYTV